MAIKLISFETFSTGWGYALEGRKEIIVLGLKIDNQHFRVKINSDEFNNSIPDLQIGDSFQIELHLPTKRKAE